MPNDISLSIRGVTEAQQQLQAVDKATADPQLIALLSLAAGQVHRYLMSLGKDTPPVGITGVLPVITGRLKNSFFWGTGRQGNSLVGYVATNLIYAPEVERRRGFLAKTIKDMEGPVNSLFGRGLPR